MLSNRMTFQRFVVRNITEDRVGNCDLRCIHAFLCFIYLFISLTNLFSPFFPVQTSHWTDILLCKLALKGTTGQAPRKKKINTENNEQATRQQKYTFLHLRCQNIYSVPVQRIIDKAMILHLNAFIISRIHIVNARPHIAQPLCYWRASSWFHPAKWRDYANVNICLCNLAR